jgi:hypothetical protein
MGGALLREPGSFEGLIPVAVEPKGHRPASPELPEPGNAPIDAGPTFPALPLAVKHRHHRVARDARLLDVPTVALPSVSHSFTKPSNPVGPSVGIRVEDALRHIHQEVVIAKLDDTFGIASVQVLVDPLHDLDVLLRHRPRSIPPRGAGA